ncbi:hypothetical protein OOU_Y34scaffold00206g13 [Pyricularia oryzae Y34]|uniref:Uncharacterized protein n=2 Tax=Pyricularia oryzae TaxID=318829 RepID=A0AA97P5Y7_PYRO3|nr:hypothetical protein OOU_Y34scaffold00206g13 [Pyricularia oryzae Y34]
MYGSSMVVALKSADVYFRTFTHPSIYPSYAVN